MAPGLGVGVHKIRGPYRKFVGLLDESYASGATAAYSVRLLRADHSGGIIRVREDSGNTEQDFTESEITDGTLASFCGSANGLVTKWYDQSGNGNDASNSTAAEQPKIYDSSSGLVTENGKPALDFDGADDYLDTPDNFNNFTNTAGIAVSNPVDSSGYPRIIHVGDSRGSGDKIILLNDSIDNTRLLTPDNDIVISNDSTDFYSILDFTENQNGAELYRNGTLLGSGNTSASSKTNMTRIGIGARPTGVGYFKGNMQEVIFYGTDKENELSNIRKSINSYYKIY